MNQPRSGQDSQHDAKRRRYAGLRRALNYIGAIELPVIFLLTLASGYYTYHGALVLDVDASSNEVAWFVKEHALVISAAATLVLFFLLSVMMKVFPELDWLRLNLFGWPLLGLIALVVVGISSYFNLAGMIGRSALLDDMQDRLPEVVHSANAAVAQVEADGKYVSELSDLGEVYSTQAKQEQEHGMLSGQRNPGPVYGTLLAIADTFSKAAASARAKHDAMKKISDGFESELAAMASARLPYEDAGISERQRAFYQNAEKIRLGIVKLARVDVAEDLRLAFVNAGRTEGSIGRTGYQISSQQINALTDLFRSLSDRQRTYLPEQVLQQREQYRVSLLDQAAVPLAVPTVYDATWRYKFHYIPYLILAVLLDTAIIPVMLMKMLARWQMLADSVDLSVLDRITGAELEAIRLALNQSPAGSVPAPHPGAASAQAPASPARSGRDDVIGPGEAPLPAV